MAELSREREGQADSTTELSGSRSEEPPQGLALQLADSKAKLRRLKQQLWVCRRMRMFVCVMKKLPRAFFFLFLFWKDAIKVIWKKKKKDKRIKDVVTF